MFITSRYSRLEQLKKHAISLLSRQVFLLFFGGKRKDEMMNKEKQELYKKLNVLIENGQIEDAADILITINRKMDAIHLLLDFGEDDQMFNKAMSLINKYFKKDREEIIKTLYQHHLNDNPVVALKLLKVLGIHDENLEKKILANTTPSKKAVKQAPSTISTVSISQPKKKLSLTYDFLFEERKKLSKKYECFLCKREITEDADLARCPHCNETFHRSEFYEYVKIMMKCPSCEEKIDLKDV